MKHPKLFIRRHPSGLARKSFLLSLPSLLVFITVYYLYISNRQSWNLFHRSATVNPTQQCPGSSTYTRIQDRSSAIPKPASLRVIIITYDRVEPLQRCMEAAENAYYLGNRIDLSVFIDRSKSGKVNQEIISIASKASWSHGAKHVNVWDGHVGLYGQWIDTFIPKSDNDRAVILEDDIEVSPYFFQWLDGARMRYSHRSDIAGYSLQRATLRADQRVLKGNISINPRHPVYLYLLVGSWGYSPEPRSWILFREWFHRVNCDPTVDPAVEGLRPSAWFKSQRQRRTMWTMWHIKFADMHKLYTLYANLGNSKTLGANWREYGLHFVKRNTGKSHSPGKDFDTFNDDDFKMQNSTFIFPQDPIKLGWNGSYDEH